MTKIVGLLIGLLIFGFGLYYLIKEKVRSPCYNVGTKGNTGGMVIVAVLENYFCFCRSNWTALDRRNLGRSYAICIKGNRRIRCGKWSAMLQT